MLLVLRSEFVCVGTKNRSHLNFIQMRDVLLRREGLFGETGRISNQRTHSYCFADTADRQQLVKSLSVPLFPTYCLLLHCVCM